MAITSGWQSENQGSIPCGSTRKVDMKKRKNVEKYWKAIDALFPKHRMAGQWHEMYRNTHIYCTDDTPNGWGNFGCKRCDAIGALEKRRIKIWPRSVMTGSATEWEDEKEVAKVHKVGFKKAKK